MKSIANILLVGAITAMAIAISAAPSEAAKRQKAKACAPMMSCSVGCKKGTCNVMSCGADGKMHKATFQPVCTQPFCPPVC